MVQCVRCSDWFHEQCAKEKYRASHGGDVDLEDESVDFVCETCERSGVGDGEKAGDDGMSVHCDNAISKPGDTAVSKPSDTPISKPTDPSQPSDIQNALPAPEDTHDEETRLEKQIRARLKKHDKPGAMKLVRETDSIERRSCDTSLNSHSANLRLSSAISSSRM